MHSIVRIAFASTFFLSTAGLLSAPALADDPSAYAALIASHAAENGVSVELASAVVRHESNFNPHVTGRAGEIGLMQIKLSTARALGYRGSRAGLYDPETNITWGMIYLGQAQQLAGGSQCGTLSRYNAGLYTRRLVRSYCRGVMSGTVADVAQPRVKRVEVADATPVVRHHHKGKVQVAEASSGETAAVPGFLRSLLTANAD